MQELRQVERSEAIRLISEMMFFREDRAALIIAPPEAWDEDRGSEVEILRRREAQND